MSEKFTITKLTGSENYATWAADLRVVLRHHRHWSWIEGANEQPPPKIVKAPTSSAATAAASTDVENPAYATWEDGASDTLYHIMMTCESNVKDQIRQISVPSEVWKRLKKSVQTVVDVVVICPLQAEGAYPLEPRIRSLPSASSDPILTGT